MKKFTLIGNNITYSLSPKIHTEIYNYLGVEAEYTLTQVDPFGLEDAIEDLKELDGFNVTQPHKKNILGYLDRNTSKLGAVNTVKVTQGMLTGYNTDYDGFKAHILKVYDGFEGAEAVVEGAGGMAQIAALVLKELGSKVYITNRTYAKAEGLALKTGAKIMPQDGSLAPKIYVNCSSQGLVDKTYAFPKGDYSRLEFAYDAIYFDTPFLQEAKLWQCPIVENGLPMLVMQAIYAAQIFFGIIIDEKDALCDNILNMLSKSKGENKNESKDGNATAEE